MNYYENFYKYGFEIINFNSLDLNDVLRQILNGNLKSDFSLQQKYSSTVDLRPNVIDYHPSFINVLKENGVKSIIKSRTLKDLTLYHVQVRISSSTTSYMDWHRDTYYDAGKKIGMTPPGHKIIYYPNFEEKQQVSRLHVAPSSHRLMIDNRQEDLRLTERLPKSTITTSNEKALFFDASLMHAVVPDRPNEVSIRLIYSFISKEQLIDSGSDELHHRTSKLYEELV